MNICLNNSLLIIDIYYVSLLHFVILIKNMNLLEKFKIAKFSKNKKNAPCIMTINEHATSNFKESHTYFSKHI